MEIKKHTFDVLNTDDLQRSLGNCIMRFNGSVILLREFYSRDGEIACSASKINPASGPDLIGREFRLGVNQLRAAFDPDNLLPVIRSGFVNIYEEDTGGLTGRYFLQRKIGGYVRGYGERSVRVGATYTDGPHVVSSWTSDSYRILRVLHSAFTGGMYVSFEQAVATLTDFNSSYTTTLAISPTMLLFRVGTEVWFHYSMCNGMFKVIRQDDGTYKVDTRSNRLIDSRTQSTVSRTLPKVVPCL
jgi:hypothetical protein